LPKVAQQNPHEKIYLANDYNFVIIAGDTCRLIAPKAFGVAEVEKPQSGGADCGYTSALRVKGKRGVPRGPYQKDAERGNQLAKNLSCQVLQVCNYARDL
jgi:uncharacterized protein affecting Mg2+/Co2+ transport